MALPAERLAADLTHLALCWRLVRRDGVALGFTSHDRSMLVAGLRHQARPGMSPSAVVLGDGVSADDLEVAGALSAGALTRADLLAGRWDGARVELFLVDWRDPDAGRQWLAEGTLGDVAVGEAADAGFVAELLGPGAALARSVIESCSPECRAELGDARCRVNMRGRERITIVSAQAPDRLRLADVSSADQVQGRHDACWPPRTPGCCWTSHWPQRLAIGCWCAKAATSAMPRVANALPTSRIFAASRMCRAAIS
jgi:hypothetical protein